MAPYANYPAHVKLARLMHWVFPPARSNFVATVAKDAVDAPSRGTQRIERIKFDDFGSEIDRADYRAKIGRDVDYERRRTAIARWQRMRRSVGIGNGQLTPKHENLLQRFAEEFFRAEDLFNMATNTADPAADLPQSLTDAPWITLPEPDRAAPSQYTAPYTPHVNECPKPSSQKSKLWPNKYQPPKKYHNGRKLRTHRWAFGVYNAKDENANNRLKKMFPEPPPMRGEVIVKILRDYRPPEQQQQPAREFIKYADHCFVNTKSAGLMGMEVTPVAYKSTKDPIALISTGELTKEPRTPLREWRQRSAPGNVIAWFDRSGATATLRPGKMSRKWWCQAFEPKSSRWWRQPSEPAPKAPAPNKYLAGEPMQDFRQAFAWPTYKQCDPDEYCRAIEQYLAGEITYEDMKSRIMTPTPVPSMCADSRVLFEPSVTLNKAA